SRAPLSILGRAFWRSQSLSGRLSLSGEVFYQSSRLGAVPVSRMAIPHARRVLDSLGADADPLLRAALVERVARAGATDPRAVPFGDASGVMIRDRESGRFTGAAFRSLYRKGDR